MKRHRLFLFGYVCLFFLLCRTLPLFCQTLDFTSKPVVIYYGCDHSAVTGVAGSGEADTILNTASYYIYRAIANDSQTQQIIFMANESADTVAADTALDIFSAPPDSFVQAGDQSGYWLGSTVTESNGKYTLTIYIEDSFTKNIFAADSSTFSSITSAEVKNACDTVAAKLLPINIQIQNYEKQLKQENPSLNIDPIITLSPAKSDLNYNESTNVTITAADLDGTPIPNMTVHLDAQFMGDGSFSVDSVITGADGKANAVFTAGNLDAVIELIASIDGVPLVTHNTTRISDAEDIFIGNGSVQDILWKGKFKYKSLIIALEDGATYSQNSWGSSRKTYYENSSTSGTILCDVGDNTGGRGYGLNPLSIDFTYILSGITKGSYQSSYLSTSVSYSLSQKGTCFSFSKSTTDEKGDAYAPDDYSGLSELLWAVVDTEKGLPFDTLCTFGPNYNTERKYRNRNFYIGTCGYGNSKDSLFIPASAVSPFANIQPGSPDGKISLDTNLIEFQYSHSKDTASSKYEITFDAGGAHVSYTSTFNDTITQFTATFRPFGRLPASVDNSKNNMPVSYSLSQNYPNPFNPTTVIKYQIPKNNFVNLKVYDILGRLVETLVNKKQEAGSYSVVFDANNLASGVYFYRISAGNFTETKKLVLLK